MTDWYVRPSGGTYGAENGTSYDAAWDGFANIVWGGAGVVAGDTLYVAGTHRETMTVGTSGTAALPIRIDGNVAGDRGRISGADVITSWTGPDVNGEYTNAATSKPFFVRRDGVLLFHGTEGSLTADEWAYNNTGTVTLLGFDPTGLTIEVGKRGNGILVSGVDYIRTHSIHFDTYKQGVGLSPHTIKNSVGSWCFDCTFSGCFKSTDIRGTSSYCGTIGCSGDHCGDGPDINKETTRPNNITIRFNHFTGLYTGTAAPLIDWFANVETTHGIVSDGECYAVTDAGDNITVEDNFASNYNKGFSTLVLVAEVDRNGWKANRNEVMLCFDDGLDFRRNTAVNELCNNFELVSNIIHTFGASVTGSANASALQAGASSGAKFMNVIINNNSCYGFANTFLVGGNNVLSCKNNISSKQITSGTVYHLNYTLQTTAANLTSNYNCVWDTGGYRWVGGPFRAQASWTLYQGDATPNDANSLNLDPLFKSPANGDLRLDGGSPCLAAGTQWWTGEARHGEDGLRFKNSPSIGAYEVHAKSGYARKGGALVANTLPAGVDIAKARAA